MEEKEEKRCHLWVHNEQATICQMGANHISIRPGKKLTKLLQPHFPTGHKPLGVVKYHTISSTLEDGVQSLQVGDRLSCGRALLYPDGNWVVVQSRIIEDIRATRIQGIGIVIIPNVNSEENEATGPWTVALIMSMQFKSKSDKGMAVPETMTEGAESLKTGDVVWFSASEGSPDYLDEDFQLIHSDCQYTISCMRILPTHARDTDPLIPGYPVRSLTELRSPPLSLPVKETLECISVYWRNLLNFESHTQERQLKQKVLFPQTIEFTQWRCPIKAFSSYPATKAKLNPKLGDTLKLEAFLHDHETIQRNPFCSGKAVVTDCHPNGEELLVNIEFCKNSSLDFMLMRINQQQTVFQVSPVHQDLTLENFKLLRTQLNLILKQGPECRIKRIFDLLMARTKFNHEPDGMESITVWPYGRNDIPGVGTFEPDTAQEVIFHAICTEEQSFAVIGGAAGCGKTRTLGCTLYRLLDQRLPSLTRRLCLVMAGSNRAVDVIAALLAKMSSEDTKTPAIIRPLRIYAPAKEVENTLCASIALHEVKFKVHDDTPDHIKDAIQEYQNLEQELQNVSLEDLEGGKAQEEKQRANEIVKQMKGISQTLENHVLMNGDYNVVLTTLGNSMDQRLKSQIFTHGFIDESGQAKQLEVMMGISKLNVRECQGAYLVGDKKQLPPTVLASGLAGELLAYTTPQQLSDCNIIQEYPLLRCYRMHPNILDYPNEHIYNGQLYSGVTADQRSEFSHLFPFPNKRIPVLFCDVKGPDEQVQGYSRHNNHEINSICMIMDYLVTEAQIDPTKIGLLTFYEEQRTFLNMAMQQLGLQIQSMNIDNSQGEEFPIVLLSCVRSSPQGKSMSTVRDILGFLTHPGRRCVSLTRARSGLIVVGDASTLEKDPGWKSFIDFCRKAGSLIPNFTDYLVQLNQYATDDWYDEAGMLILPSAGDNDVVLMESEN